MLGLLQYLAPIIQFLIGVTYFGEHMPTSRWIRGLVWLALVVFTVDVTSSGGRSTRCDRGRPVWTKLSGLNGAL